MSQDTQNVIQLSDFPEAAKPCLEKHKLLTGMDFAHSSDGWSLILNKKEASRKGSKLVCPAKPIALNGNMESVVHDICSILCRKHEKQYDLVLSDIPQHIMENQNILGACNLDPCIAKRHIGLVLDLHNTATRLLTARSGTVKQLFKERILPLMMSELQMTFVVPVRLDIDYLQAICRLAQIHFAKSKEKEFEEAVTFYNDDSAQEVFEMRHGMYFQNFLTSLTRFGNLNITYPFRRHNCAWYFFKEGDCIESPLTKTGISNVLLAADNPRSSIPIEGVRTHEILVEASKHHSFAKQCIYGSVYGLNNLLEYLCNLTNFVTAERELDSKRFLQTISTIRLMQADFQGISITQDPNTQLVLALAYLDKMANLTNGIAEGGNNDERMIFKNWVKKNRPQIIKKIFERRFTKQYQKFGNALTQSMRQCYMDTRKTLAKRKSGGNKYNEIESRFQDLRSINHGAFLQRGKEKKEQYADKFERLYFESGEELPREVSMLPYYLLWGFILSPKEFVEKMSEKIRKDQSEKL